MNKITVVLWGVQKSGNLGAICRVMKNFGFTNIVLIDPRCKIGSLESRKRAKHSQDILQNVKVSNSDVLSKFDTIIGTTSKIGSDYNIARSPIYISDFSVKIPYSGKVAIVFGNEKDGLRNDQISLCDYVVSIPTANQYSALNLSHAVAIVLYELSKFKLIKLGSIAGAGRQDKDQIMKMLDKAMKTMDFLGDDKKDTQRLVWKRLISKSGLTKREAFTLMGFLRKIN